jgi:hypothetical protein
MPQFSDDLFLGPVSAPGPIATGNASPMEIGVGPMGRVYVFDVVPLTLQVAGLAAVQLLGAAGNFTLAAGTGVTSRVRADGTTEYVLDTPRCITATVATTDQSGVNLTFYGYDLYGQPMTETIAGPNANTVAGRKAFKTVTRVAASAAVATNGISIGFNDKLGLPFRVSDVCYIQSVKWATTLADDAGTAVAADATSPATVSTTDVRGCYTPSSAANGTRRLVMTIALPALAAGPNATRIGAFGVTQV